MIQRDTTSMEKLAIYLDCFLLILLFVFTLLIPRQGLVISTNRQIYLFFVTILAYLPPP